MRKVPLPFDPAEFIGTEEARRRAGVAQRTIREWCALHRIGRRIAGRWRVSQVALDMLLSEDRWRCITQAIEHLITSAATLRAEI